MAGLLLLPAPCLSQTSGIRTYCNPLDIDYKYNFEQLNQGISYRSGADPVVVNHKGEYYLFVTVSGGYWHSKDLLHWRFVTPSRWPFEDIVAPAAISVGDTLLLMISSFDQRPILYPPTRQAAGSSSITGCFHRSPTTRRIRCLGDRARLVPGTPRCFAIPAPSAGISTGARPTCIRYTASNSIPPGAWSTKGNPRS